MFTTTTKKWTLSAFPSLPLPTLETRRRIQRVKVCSAQNSKVATLSANRRQRIKLPSSENAYRIAEFVNHQSGIEAMLNSNAMESYEYIESNTYRCILPKIQLLNIEASPVMDLKVIPTQQDCTIEMVSCTFKGSDVLDSSWTSAFMVNHVTWNTTDSSKSFLEANIKLIITLEIVSLPFTLLPISAVEGPGNLVLQALVDRLVTLLLEQIMRDYRKWANQQCYDVS